MADKSAIEWTDATWNPIRARNRKTGKVGWHCTHASEGCRLCYAESFNKRLGTGLAYKPGHESDIELYLDDDVLMKPSTWKRPRRIFVGSMTDLFGDFVKDEWLADVFHVMASLPEHTFQVLTKRAERMRDVFSRPKSHDEWHPVYWHTGMPRNVWLGVSVENQETAEERIPLLVGTPAAKRFLSCEPLLGPINFKPLCKGCPGDALDDCWVPGVDWVICGGESGAKARPMHPDWARSLRDQCKAAGVPFFFKQWGEYASVSEVAGPGKHFHFPDGTTVRRVGKKHAGRLLGGISHNEFPA